MTDDLATIDAETLAEPAIVADDEVEEQDIPEGEEPDAPDEVVPDPDAAVVAEPEPVDFAFDYNGKPYAIPGLKYLADKKQLTAADDKAMQRMQTLLRHGRDFEETGRQTIKRLEREVRDAQQAQTQETAQAKAFSAEFERLMDPAIDDDQLLALLKEIRHSFPVALERAKREHLEQQLEAARRGPEPDEPDVNELVDWGVAAVTEKMQEALDGLPWATEAVRGKLIGVMTSRPYLDRMVRKAERDFPEAGIRQGTWYVDWKAAHELYAPLEEAYIEAHGARQTSAQQVASLAPIAKQNARVLATTKPAAAVPTKAPPPKTRTVTFRDPVAEGRAAADARIRDIDREFSGR